jgi:hypothetical protein
MGNTELVIQPNHRGSLSPQSNARCRAARRSGPRSLSIYTGVGERGANDCRERARVEATATVDPWIFVRSCCRTLVMRARARWSRVDGARHHPPSLSRRRRRHELARAPLPVCCMPRARKRAVEVGRFGVGFWSILRAEPEHRIRSCPRAAMAAARGRWCSTASSTPSSRRRTGPGTEILLEQPRLGRRRAPRVRAHSQSARFLACATTPSDRCRSPSTVASCADFALHRQLCVSTRARVGSWAGSAPQVRFAKGLGALCQSMKRHRATARAVPELPGGWLAGAARGEGLICCSRAAAPAMPEPSTGQFGKTAALVRRAAAHAHPNRPGSVAHRRCSLAESTWWRAALGLRPVQCWPCCSPRSWPGHDLGAMVQRRATEQAEHRSARSRYGDLRNYRPQSAS